MLSTLGVDSKIVHVCGIPCTAIPQARLTRNASDDGMHTFVPFLLPVTDVDLYMNDYEKIFPQVYPYLSPSVVVFILYFVLGRWSCGVPCFVRLYLLLCTVSSGFTTSVVSFSVLSFSLYLSLLCMCSSLSVYASRSLVPRFRRVRG